MDMDMLDFLLSGYYLYSEFEDYVSVVEMSDEERSELEEWVNEGNSVHDNPLMVCNEWGESVDFLDVFRWERKTRQELSQLDEKGQKDYLARLRHEDTIDNLREDLEKVERIAEVCYDILQKHGLLNEVFDILNENAQRALPQTTVTDDNNDEDLPFSLI